MRNMLMIVAGAVMAFAVQAEDAFRWTEQPGGKLELTENNRPVLVFNYGLQLKEGVKEQFRRADYFHPIYDLDGVIITEDFPKDHFHHRGLFWGWPEVTVGGKTYDPWACVGMQQRFKRWITREAKSDCAVLGVENGWFLGGQSVIRETVEARIHRCNDTGRAMDVAITLEAEKEPVSMSGRHVGNKGYGGFTLRVAPRRDPSVSLPTGRVEKDAIQVKAPWADYSAKFGTGAAVSGVAIFDHPKNPCHPTTWMTRYYGVLNPTWPALETAKLEPGKPVTLRYRLWIHRGDCAAGKVAQAHAEWLAAK
ncbi:MAG: PmoA family protein [Verrucomicrobiia bacterium]